MHPYHPYIAALLVGERQSRLLRAAQTARLTRQAAGEYRSARAVTATRRVRWTDRVTIHRGRAALAARMPLHHVAPLVPRVERRPIP